MTAEERKDYLRELINTWIKCQEIIIYDGIYSQQLLDIVNERKLRVKRRLIKMKEERREEVLHKIEARALRQAIKSIPTTTTKKGKRL